MLRRPGRGVLGSAVVAAVLTTSSCGGVSVNAANGDQTLRIFTAASLTDAMTDMAAAFTEDVQGDDLAPRAVEVELNVAGSATLREQILSGAPGDVFVSANEQIMTDVAAADGISGEIQLLASNSMTVITPPDNPADVTGVADLARRDLLIGLCAEGVPCGDFAADIVKRAGVTPDVDTFEDDVRSLVTRVAAGELDAAIVYRSDVVAAGSTVESIAIPDELNVEAHSVIAVLGASDQPDLAAMFVNYARSTGGQQILEEHGFGVPAP